MSHQPQQALLGDGPFEGRRAAVRAGHMEWSETERFDIDQGHSIVTTHYRYHGATGNDPDTVVFEYVTQEHTTSVVQ
jgi:hypothetical protein